MIILALLGLIGVGLLVRASRIRHHLEVVPDLPAYGVAEALELTPDGPVAVGGRATRHGASMLAAPASGRPCVWWSLRVLRHPRLAFVFTYNAPPFEKVITSERPFLLADGTSAIRVDHDSLMTYGHPHSFHVSERIPQSWSQKVPTVTERVRDSLPEVVPPPDGRGTRRMGYTEWLIEEGDELTVTGRLDFDATTGQATLRAHTSSDRPAIFSMTLGTNHTDVGHLRRSYRRTVRTGYTLVGIGVLALLCGLASLWNG